MSIVKHMKHGSEGMSSGLHEAREGGERKSVTSFTSCREHGFLFLSIAAAYINESMIVTRMFEP